jgi:hypothetical protein
MHSVIVMKTPNLKLRLRGTEVCSISNPGVYSVSPGKKHVNIYKGHDLLLPNPYLIISMFISHSHSTLQITTTVLQWKQLHYESRCQKSELTINK